MNKQAKLFLACSIFFSFSFLFNQSYSIPVSKYYKIDQVTINAEILPDGSIVIQENRSYDFRGSFRWADYSLPLDKLGKVTDFELSEGETIYQNQPGKEAGTYQVEQNEKQFYVKWHYRASYESRTFSLKYRVEDAVTVYDDVAELYYKFVGEDSPKKIGSVDVWLTLPQPADTGQVRAWAHGPLHGQLAFENEKIRLWVSPLPRKNWWEVRTIFPPVWVPSARKQQDGFIKNKILDEERSLVEKSNAARMEIKKKQMFREKYRSTAFEASWIFLLIGIVVFALIYSRFGRAYAVPFYTKVNSEIPEDVSPAIASYVYYSGQIGAGAIVATLFDLARRGFLKLEETQGTKKTLFGKKQKSNYALKMMPEFYDKNKNSLTAHEQNMIEFIFNDLAAGKDEIQFDEIKHSRRSVVKWFSRWKKLVVESWGKRPFFDRASFKGAIISAICSLITVAVGILLTINFGEAGLPALIGGIVLFGLSFVILRYTKEFKLLRTRLVALRKYLSKYHFRQDSSRLQSTFENYLIYGVALGIGQKAIKEMVALIPDWQSASFMPWYMGASGHGTAGGFADAVATMVSTTASTMGSAAGVGGAASAGGGAGAGGAAGGAG